MDLEDQFQLEHLLFRERWCKVCGEKKNLIEEFYRTRKDKGSVPSSYSYECKECTIKRITEKRKEQYNPVPRIKDVYPDW